MYIVIAYFCTCKLTAYAKLSDALHQNVQGFGNILNSKKRCAA